MWLRACLDWTPSTVILGESQGRASGVMFTLPMSPPRELPRRPEDLRLVYQACGFTAELD